MKKFLVLILCAIMFLTGCSSPVKQTTETFEDLLYQSFVFKEETLNTPLESYEVKGKVPAEKVDKNSTIDYFILIPNTIVVRKPLSKKDKWGNNITDYKTIEIGDFLFLYTLSSYEGRSYVNLYTKQENYQNYSFIVDSEKETFIKIIGVQGYTYTDGDGRYKTSNAFVMDYNFAVKNEYIEDVKDYSFN